MPRPLHPQRNNNQYPVDRQGSMEANLFKWRHSRKIQIYCNSWLVPLHKMSTENCRLLGRAWHKFQRHRNILPNNKPTLWYNTSDTPVISVTQWDRKHRPAVLHLKTLYVQLYFRVPFRETTLKGKQRHLACSLRVSARCDSQNYKPLQKQRSPQGTMFLSATLLQGMEYNPRSVCNRCCSRAL